MDSVRLKNKIEEEAVKRLNDFALKYATDQEALHSLADDLVIEYLRLSGSEKLANKYDQIRDDIGFWYA